MPFKNTGSAAIEIGVEQVDTEMTAIAFHHFRGKAVFDAPGLVLLHFFKRERLAPFFKFPAALTVC